MKPLRVLVLMHPDFMPPESSKGYSQEEVNVWKTEYDVVSTLRANGHEVKPLGVQHELKPIRDEIENWKPHVVFNLLEQFHGDPAYDQNVASYLELLRIPYTGCNPRGLMLARGKDLSKQLMAYHRIPVPDFAVFPINRKIKRPSRLALPLIVKSVSEDASWGIARASVVDSDEKLQERVKFIHERIGTPAIAEQFIEGREIYVGVIGNDAAITFAGYGDPSLSGPAETRGAKSGRTIAAWSRRTCSIMSFWSRVKNSVPKPQVFRSVICQLLETCVRSTLRSSDSEMAAVMFT